MYKLHVSCRSYARRAIIAVQGTARGVLNGTGHALAAALPFVLFFGVLVCCLVALLPATHDSNSAPKRSLLSQPLETIKGPGRYIYIKARMRLAPGATFTPAIDAPLVPVDLWFTENPSIGWCVSKPGALAFCNEHESALFSTGSAANGATVETLSPVSYCQLPFINYLMWGRELFPMEGNIARCRNYQVSSKEISGNSGGRNQLRVTITGTGEPATLRADANSFTNWFDARLVKMYVVDKTSHDLREARVSTMVSGHEVVLLQTEAISYSPTRLVHKAMQKVIGECLASVSPLIAQ